MRTETFNVMTYLELAQLAVEKVPDFLGENVDFLASHDGWDIRTIQEFSISGLESEEQCLEFLEEEDFSPWSVLQYLAQVSVIPSGNYLIREY